MDEVEQIVFEQTIFPPVEKKINEISFISAEKTSSKLFDSWIISGDLFVKCPCCDFVYKLFTDIDTGELQGMIEAYSMKYFQQIVSDCPQRKTHGGVNEHYV